MEIEFNEIMARYEAEIAALTRRAIMAEAERDALKREADGEPEPDTGADG